jgi:hypothetical protein
MKQYCVTGRRNHGRHLKGLLDTWDRNGSTSGPTAWKIDDDDDDEPISVLTHTNPLHGDEREIMRVNFSELLGLRRTACGCRRAVNCLKGCSVSQAPVLSLSLLLPCPTGDNTGLSPCTWFWLMYSYVAVFAVSVLRNVREPPPPYKLLYCFA